MRKLEALKQTIDFAKRLSQEIGSDQEGTRLVQKLAGAYSSTPELTENHINECDEYISRIVANSLLQAENVRKTLFILSSIAANSGFPPEACSMATEARALILNYINGR